MSPLDRFAASLTDASPRDIARGLIGEDAVVDSPFGPKPLIYADYVASGRALMQVEEFMLREVLPYYANTHTQASYCGEYMTRLREAARAQVARLTGADASCSVIFAGAGSTAGINRIVGLLDIGGAVARGDRVVVLTGPYEHHSNILPWRETGAAVVEIPEAPGGGVDLTALAQTLAAEQGADMIVGTFSAASNVTGILADVDAITLTLKAHGALAIWDYGCAGPYCAMDMKPGTDAAKDAIVFSAHKFPGGPGASGVAVLRTDIARRRTPTLPGGGTVSFVSPWDHVYSSNLSTREEGGTPNVTGDIRVAMAMLVKEALGQSWLRDRQTALRARALSVWRRNPRLQLLGELDAPALPIFSFRVRDGQGGMIHHQLFTRMLSDLHGIQARGGCACAGPYAHRLLGLDRAGSQATYAALTQGKETEKPGWVRLNLSALMCDEKVDTIIAAVDDLARTADGLLHHYTVDPATARFRAEPMAASA